MKKYIFTIAFALLGITSSMASKADTLRIYSIDGERIPNFTGKELIGKTIKNYQVNTNVLPAPKRDVVETDKTYPFFFSDSILTVTSC